MNERELLNLKSQIDEAKTSVAELTGQRNALLKQLKDTFKCNNVDEAIKKAELMKKQIQDIDDKISQGSKELEEKYNL